MLTIAILVIHILVSLALVFLILMHSGKGGGLSDMFGGSVGQAASGRPWSRRTSTASRSPSR